MPCYHGAAVITEKYGTVNTIKFVASRHLTEAWKNQYKNLVFDVPTQAEVDEVLDNGRLMVATGNNLQVPVALPPPRGRPIKNSGRRRKSWYERGTAATKKRNYSCSLCRRPGHTAVNCDLKQSASGDSGGIDCAEGEIIGDRDE